MIENRLEIQNVLRDLFITRMHRIRNSVAVITTKKNNISRFGTAVNAFSPVSADPPQLLAYLHSTSRIATAIKTHKTFCLRVLSENEPKNS